MSVRVHDRGETSRSRVRRIGEHVLPLFDALKLRGKEDVCGIREEFALGYEAVMIGVELPKGGSS